MDHEITVEHLQRLLEQLDAQDVLVPNTVANLMIVRNGAYIGFINLLEGGQCIELSEEVSNGEEAEA